MKRITPKAYGEEFWKGMSAKFTEYMAYGIPKKESVLLPALSAYRLSEKDYLKIQDNAKFEAFCFGAFCAQLLGVKKYKKIIGGVDTAAWSGFCDVISSGLHRDVSTLKLLDIDGILPADKEADATVISYLQTFTRGKADANMLPILIFNRNTLAEVLSDYDKQLERVVSAFCPNGDYPRELMRWCPDGEKIYNFAAEFVDKK